MTILYIFLMAALNRARGSQWGGLLNSTAEGRIFATLGMGVATECLAVCSGYSLLDGAHIALWTWGSLYLWCVFAWDNYWSAAIGNTTDITKPTFAPVDFIMKRLPTMPLRIWGLIAMTLRCSLAAVCIIGLACITGHTPIYAVGTLAIGSFYYIAGYVLPKLPIALAEYATGAWLGVLIAATIL